MKYRISAIIVIFMLLFSINVYAADYKYDISLGEDFTFAQYGDDLTQISQKLNISADDLSTYFNKNGLLYLAVSDDTTTQIRLSAFTDNFSSAVGDMSQLSNEALAEFLDAVSDSSDNTADIITNGERKFIRTKSTLQDSGGVYTVTQYITICSNKTFYFAGYNQGEDTSPEVESAFKSLSLTNNQNSSKDYTLPLIYVIVGIIVFEVVAVFMIIGIIKIKIKTEE